MAPPGVSFILEPLWMRAKIFGLSFVVSWLRATYPRMHEDQLQRMSWLAMIPIALAPILVVGIVQVATA